MIKFFVSLFLIFFAADTCAQLPATYVFVGTYTDGKPDHGIYVYRLNMVTGVLDEVSRSSNLTNPSFLTVSPNGHLLYACTDTRKATEGSITSFAIDSNTGRLSLISKQPSGGANPVYVSVDRQSRFIVNASYTGGSLSALPTNGSGTLQPSVQAIRFRDSSVNKERQEASHVHSSVFSPDDKFVFAPDLGADKIRVFSFDGNAAQPLTEVETLTVNTQPGSGPRHIVFHPNAQFAYCTEEMSGMISAYSYNKGRLNRIQRILSYASDTATFSTADLRLSPDGRFLYASNRGENTISIFSVGTDGQLVLKGRQSTLGDMPRNFSLDPSGRFLIVANQSSNNLFVFRRDQKTGLLQKAGTETVVPSPSCVQVRAYTGGARK